MSRTLSISNNGPRAKKSPLALSIFSGVPVRQRVSGSTPVRQFNIRPLRPKRRCISLLRPAPSSRLSVHVHGGFAAARKKSADGGQRPSSRGLPGETRICCEAELPGLHHVAHSPAPACQLARYRDVGHARLLACGVHCAPPVHQPSHAGVGVPARRGRHSLPLRQLLRRPRCRLVVPCGLDQQLPQVLVAGLGDAAAALGLAA